MPTTSMNASHAMPTTALDRFSPILNWLPAYDRNWLRTDLLAGLTAWAVVVPQAIAYSGTAGLPPKAGLFATFAALLGYAVFGTSRHLIVSSTSSTAAITAALVASLALTVMACAESDAVAEELADRHRYGIRSDRELVAIGATNPLAGLFQGFIRYPGSNQERGRLVYRLDAPLLVVNAGAMWHRLREMVGVADPPPRVVLIDLAASNDLDIKGSDTLVALHQESREASFELWLAEVREPAIDMLGRTEAACTFREVHIYPTLDETVQSYRAVRDDQNVPASEAWSELVAL